MDVHHLEEAVELRLRVGVGVGYAGGGRRGARKGTPKLPNESAHGCCITTGNRIIDLNAIDYFDLSLIRKWGFGGRSFDDLRE